MQTTVASVVALLRAQCPQVRLREVPADRAAALMADDIAARLTEAVAQRGRAVLSVSGGKSPVALFEALAQFDMDWSKVTVTLVDDRQVPPEHADSNARLVRTHLLRGRAAAARFVPMVDAAADAAPWPSPTALAEAACLALGDDAMADVRVLGMGADGHTASLFPRSPDLPTALAMAAPEPVVALRLPEPRPQPPHDRLTLTLPALLQARVLMLPVQGQDKLDTLSTMLRLSPSKPDARWPVSCVLHQHLAPLELWLPV